MSTTKDRPAAAAHADALANFATLAQRAEDAHGALIAATAARQELVDKAGAGGSVSSATLLAAEEKIREAEAAHTIAVAVTKSAAATRDAAEVAMLREAAEAIRADRDAVILAGSDDARAVDAAMEAARAALARLQTTLAKLNGVDARASEHRSRMDAATSSNPVLASAHPSTWPTAPTTQGIGRLADLSVAIIRPLRTAGEAPENCIVRQPLAAMISPAGAL